MKIVALIFMMAIAASCAEPTVIGNIKFLAYKKAMFEVGCPPRFASFMGSRNIITNIEAGPFLFGKFPVTILEYCEYLNAEKTKRYFSSQKLLSKFVEIKNSKFIPITGKENWPMGGITWNAALAYCDWFSKKV